MKIARRFVLLFLLIGALAYFQGSVEAEETPCQAACGNTKQACVQDASFNYEDCADNAEFAYYTCQGPVDEEWDRCVDFCQYQIYNGCIDECGNAYRNSSQQCVDNWNNAEQICFNIEQTALASCETAYMACYDSCPP